MLSSEEEASSYELHVSCRDYRVIGQLVSDNPILGLTVVSLGSVVEEHAGSRASSCPLVRRIHMDETGWTIMRILSQRNNDTIAKEFFKLKSQVRMDMSSDLRRAVSSP